MPNSWGYIKNIPGLELSECPEVIDPPGIYPLFARVVEPYGTYQNPRKGNLNIPKVVLIVLVVRPIGSLVNVSDHIVNDKVKHLVSVVVVRDYATQENAYLIPYRINL